MPVNEEFRTAANKYLISHFNHIGKEFRKNKDNMDGDTRWEYVELLVTNSQVIASIYYANSNRQIVEAVKRMPDSAEHLEQIVLIFAG